MVEPLETLPLPDDPVLASWATAVNDAGYWAYVFDASWRWVFVTDEMRLTLGDEGATTAVPMGSHYASAEASRFWEERIGGVLAEPEGRREYFSRIGRYML